MSARTLVLIVALAMASCVAGPRGAAAAGPRGAAVQPAPPGPIDLVRILFGDYSGLCPRDYEYCHGGRHSLCCPFAHGCCAAADGSPTCCVAAPGAYDYGAGGYVPPPPAGAPPPPPPADDDGYADQPTDDSCPSSDLTCTQGGRRVCCSRDDGCCVDAHGPYCCRR
jgi:hypothetical protein